MAWRGRLYIDTALPFGLRSAPKIFTAVADALEWVLLQDGLSWSIHYIDDFLTAGCAGTDECANNLRTIKSTCEWLGVPLKWSKVEGPTTELTFLGIVLDTIKGEIRLPQERAGPAGVPGKCLVTPEGMPEAGAVITHWQASSRVQGGQTWPHLLEEND